MSAPFVANALRRETKPHTAETLIGVTAALTIVCRELVRGIVDGAHWKKSCDEWRTATDGSASCEMPMCPPVRVPHSDIGGHMADGGVGDDVKATRAPRCDWCRHTPGYAEYVAKSGKPCLRCKAWRELAAQNPPAFVLDVEADDARVAAVTEADFEPAVVVDVIEESGLGDWHPLGDGAEPTLQQLNEYVAAFDAGHFDHEPAAARDWEW
jgi:hypothetical protein